MEDFVYIILIVIWLLVSFLKRKPKADKQADVPSAGQGETDSGESREVTVDDMLEEYFGSGEKKEKPEKQEPVFNASDRRRDDRHERIEDRREKELLDQRDETPMWGKEGRKVSKRKPEAEKYADKGHTSEDQKKASEAELKTIDELIASHKKQEAMRLAREEADDSATAGLEGLPEFDLRQAVIFSEILNRKYD